MKISIQRMICATGLFFLIFCQATWADSALIKHTAVYQRIKNQVDRIRLVDTHEHLQNEDNYLKRPADFLVRMLHYVEADLVSAGMPREQGRGLKVQDADVPFAERWDIFSKYWPQMRFTGYGRALRMVVADIYGLDIDTLTAEGAAELNRKIEAANKPGLYRKILKDMARIDISIVDVGNTGVDKDFFVPVIRFDNFITVHSKRDLERFTERTGVEIKSLDDLVRALEVAFEKSVKEGIVGIKSGLAYSRRIYYPRPAKAEAQAALDKLVNGESISGDELLPLQNQMMHEVCRLAGQHNLPFQIHTGLQTGFGNHITNSKPTDLVNLIMEYPQVKFAIFHGSYPYGHELGTIAKNFANVYIDMCWMHIISPKVSRDSLSEWLETVPANKIMGFGGDYLYVEGAYAHAQMAREVVAEVLADKVVAGYMTEAEAIEVARKILRENAIELFKLPLDK